MKPFEKLLVFFLLKHLVSGMAGAVVLATGLLLLDIANLRSLVLTAESGYIGVFLLYTGLMITFGSVAMGIGVMTLGEEWGSREDE